MKEWINILFDDETDIDAVLFRVDAGRVKNLSFGHASRCLVLAKILREKYGCQIHFLMRNFPEGINYIKNAGEKVIKIPKENSDCSEFEFLESIVIEKQPDWLVVDLPYEDTPNLPFIKIRNRKVKILFLDDSRFQIPKVDAYLNSSILAPQNCFTDKLNSEDTQLLLGPDYFLFDNSLLEVPPYRSGDRPNLVLTMGGSDPSNLTIKIIEAIKLQNISNIILSIILGPGFSDIARVNQIITSSNTDMSIIENPPNIFPYLLGSDLVICNGGRTLYELISIEKKCLPIASAPHEAVAISEFMKQGLMEFGLTSWNEKDFLRLFARIIASINRDTQS